VHFLHKAHFKSIVISVIDIPRKIFTHIWNISKYH